MRNRLPLCSALLAFALATSAQERRPERAYDLLDVSWRLSFDFEQRSIQGDVTNTLRPLRDGVAELPFHCAKLDIVRVMVDGQAASWSRSGETLNVRLARPAAAGRQLAVRIVYHGKPEAGLYFVPPERAFPAKTPMVYTQGEPEDTRHWLPTWDFPDDKATSEGFVEVPKGWFALSNGRLVETRERDGKTIFRWRMEQPHATYLIALVAGPYIEGRESLEGTPILWYVPPGLEEWGRSSFAGTNRMVKFFGELTGLRYPYAKFSQSVVGDFMFGGMENITMVTNTIGTLHPPKEKPFSNSEGLVLHELAHQWFGDTVTCRDWSHIWLNEGFASFLPLYYVRKFHGEEAFDLARYGTLKGAFGAAVGSKRPVVSTDFELPIDMFDGNAYGGGAARLLMLARKVGEGAFWNGIARYLERFRFQSVSTEEFFASMSASTGVDLEAFRTQWFYKAGAPRLTLTRKGDALSITQTEPYFDLESSIWVLDQGKWVEKGVAVRGAETLVPLGPLAGKPLLFDPEVWLMAEIKYDLGYSSDDWTLLFRRAPNAAQKLRLLDAILAAGKSDLVGLLALEEGSPRILETMVPHLGVASSDLVLRLSRHTDRLVQRQAIQRLGRLPRSDESVARLREVWEKDRSDQLRRDALESLVELTGDEGLIAQAWGMDSFQDVLRGFALDWWVRNKPDLARERCLEVLTRPTSYGLMVSAVDRLGRLKDRPGERRVFEALVKVVSGDSINARSAAIRALRAYGDPAALPYLKKLQDFGFYGIRRAAREAIEALEELAKS